LPLETQGDGCCCTVFTITPRFKSRFNCLSIYGIATFSRSCSSSYGWLCSFPGPHARGFFRQKTALHRWALVFKGKMASPLYNLSNPTIRSSRIPKGNICFHRIALSTAV
jgi:hypothetical protein